MGFKWKSSESRVRQQFRQIAKQIEAPTLLRLSYLGEQCVNIGRSVNTYKDQTGNLRNSVGYVIVHNGQVVKSNFERTARVGKGKGSRDGVSEGRRIALERAAEFSSGYALIVVAGMNYAAKVESTGKDVLTSAEQFAQTELPRMLKELKIDVANIR